jgi:hypothetical protein
MKDKPTDDKWTPTEILEQVALGNMDPKEAGITGEIPIIGETQPDPTKLHVLPDAPPVKVFGDKLELKMAVVPISLRAEWEAQDAVIIPFDKEAWIEKNKNTYRIQGMMAIGSGVLRLDQTFTDPVEGFCTLLEEAAAKMRAAYTTSETENESI